MRRLLLIPLGLLLLFFAGRIFLPHVALHGLDVGLVDLMATVGEHPLPDRPAAQQSWSVQAAHPGTP